MGKHENISGELVCHNHPNLTSKNYIGDVQNQLLIKFSSSYHFLFKIIIVNISDKKQYNKIE